MKKTFFALMMMFVLLALTGCGGGHDDPPPLFLADIFSDTTVDGYIRQDGTGALQVTRAVPSVFAGLDPSSPDEFRAFLDFPLDVVPVSARIQTATVEIFIRNVLSAGSSVPMRVELVSFPPPLLAADYDSVPLIGTAVVFPIFPSDIGTFVSFDVTALMEEAQARGLSNFQIRILQDFDPPPPAPPSPPGLIEIDDTQPNEPLLSVDYF